MAKDRGMRTTAQRKKDVLAAYGECGTIQHSCKAATVRRTQYYALKRSDAKFAEEVAQVEEIVGDDLEQEAIRRAKDGSDVLLVFLLKGLKHEKYKERLHRQNVHSGPDGGPIRTKTLQVVGVPSATR